jgi:flagellar biogenesis protein FliO
MEAIQQIAAVAAVLGLLGVTLWWLRRRGMAGILPARRGSARRLESLERLTLGPQQTLHLIRLGDRALLVAASPGGCALVHNTSVREMEAAQ